MRFLKLIATLGCLLLVAQAALAEKNAEPKKSRDKRQHLSFHSRRAGRPPPYAVQMEPIAHYSQRDPLYNPLTADAKSDDQLGYYEESPYNYYPTEPEPIIEIIIKESNETLPTPVPVTQPPVQKKKEPIQVFYVKYEKKQEYGEDKPRVVYDAPIPAITPVEEHEEIKPDNAEPEGYPETLPVTPAPAEPSTTLRAIIKPDSEVYHSGSSGIRVTFGTEQVPPNNHNKRSDKDAPNGDVVPSKPTALPPPGSSKRPHGPFAPIQPIPPRVTPAFPQQRIVNSFAQQQLLGGGLPQQGPPPNFALQPQFHQSVPPPHIRNQFHQPPPPSHLSHQPPQQRPQRPPITIQGLPELQQRLPFNSFVPPHRLNVNHPQQPGSPPTISLSHQNVQLQNFPQQQQQLPQQQPAPNFNFDPQLQYKQQQREQEKQRYFEQQRLQDQRRLQEQQRQQDQYRLLEQRRKQEQEEKLRLHQQQQQQQQFQQQQFKFGQTQQQPQQQQQPQTQQQPQQQPNSEILKAIPKLEQHYAIRENPLHPGPFPPNPQYTDIPTQSLFGSQSNNHQQFVGSQQQHQSNLVQQQSNLVQQQSNLVQQQQSNLVQQSKQQIQQLPTQTTIKYNTNTYKQQSQRQQQQQQQSQRQQQQQQQPQIHHQHQQQPPTYQSQQQFFAQNLPTPQQQRPTPQQQLQQQQQQQQQQLDSSSLSQPSIWGRPVYQGKSNQKIYATPVTKSDDDFRKYSASTPNSIRYNPTTTRPTTVTSPPTRPPTTPLTTTTTTTTTVSPRNEAKIKENIANLPDEVPDDIREQLLSSGILGNADIQILDYDKVGGINIGDLPPEALANFYGAGGAAATAASEPVPQIAKRPKIVEVQRDDSEVQVAASSTNLGKNSLHGGSDEVMEEVTLRPGGVEMKVVRFDPSTAQGQHIADRHISENATRLSPVTLGEPEDASNGGQYNRYLPLKVSGASFPIPSAPELQGKRIASVVVLAPVDYGFQPESTERQNRKIASDVQAIRFLAGESLKQLVKKPTAENYKRWLEQERQTEPQRQSVVLLVTTPKDNTDAEKEIFMYDVTSESVSKLAGDLSTAFVDAAESNSDVNEDPMADVSL